jgi:4-hydroxythreonine-4-phosphate dehydrogenase
VLPVALARPAVLGRPDAANAPAVIASIELATRLALDGHVAGIVTNPVSKTVLYQAGFRHPGHTEFLGALCGGVATAMMLAAPALDPPLRVVPVTIHLALREAIARLSADSIVAAARLTAAALRRDFGIARPRLGVAALNPHAGEGGAMGDEEANIIRPAVESLSCAGIDAAGPYPADSLFTPTARLRYDAIMCMYHDQALIPLKTLDMAHGVNITLGLPIVRTSPDHGTGFDIAAVPGAADPSSLIAAVRVAAAMAARRAAA